MSHFLSYRSSPRDARPSAGAVSVKLLVTTLLAFGLGFAAAALWIHHATPGPSPAARESTTGAQPELSEGTVAVLGQLAAPVQLKFYSILDPGVPDELRSFSHRVDQLLEVYQKAAKGKLTLSRCTAISYTNANMAVRDGIKPFNLGTPEDCFLGIAVRRNDQHESLPQLSPQWEPALEIDITRAIAAVAGSKQAPGIVPATPKPDAATVAELKNLLPNLDSLSVADGTRLLRDAALKDFAEAAKDSQLQLQEAQQRLAEAKNGGTDADQQAAIKHLQEVQAAQSKRLQEIAARSQAQIEALRKFKQTGQ